MSNRFYAGQADYIQKLNDMDDAGVRMGNSYYGAFATAPTQRPDTTARQAGDRYFDTVAIAEKTWNGSAWYIPNIDSAGLALPGGAGLVGYLPAGTGSVPTTVQDELRNHVSVKQFGAKGDGATDDRAAIQAALDTGKAVYFPTPSVSYYITDQISPRPNQLLYGDGYTSHIQIIDGSKNAIYGNSVDGVTIRDLKISTKTQANATAYRGAVVAFNCNKWRIENVFAFNMGYWGVGLYDSSYCVVTGCRFATWFGAVQDSADIAIYNNSSFNLIEGNFCYALGADAGVFMQDPYSGATPTGNRILRNFVGEHKGYGIIAYVTTAYNTRTLIAYNDVRDIAGTALGGLSGHGIYIQSAGGTRAVNNTIVNCARFTTDFETQVVAGIGVAIGEYATGVLTVVDVSHNHVVMNRGPCIVAATSAVPVNIAHNYTEQAGTEAVRSECIRTINVRRGHVVHNIAKQANPNYQTIGVIASAQTIDGGTLAHNDVTTVKYGIQVAGIGGGAFSALNYGDNRVSGGNDQATSVANVTNLRFHNNSLKSTGIAAVFDSCPASRFTANTFDSTYTPYSVIFTGTMTGSICDESNLLTGRVENDGGIIIVRYDSAIPASVNICAVGERTIQSVPVVGNPKGWRCTVAGAPGTWVSEGNL